MDDVPLGIEKELVAERLAIAHRPMVVEPALCGLRILVLGDPPTVDDAVAHRPVGIRVVGVPRRTVLRLREPGSRRAGFAIERRDPAVEHITADEFDLPGNDGLSRDGDVVENAAGGAICVHRRVPCVEREPRVDAARLIVFKHHVPVHKVTDLLRANFDPVGVECIEAARRRRGADFLMMADRPYLAACLGAGFHDEPSVAQVARPGPGLEGLH